jgi:uncharacterized protein
MSAAPSTLTVTDPAPDDHHGAMATLLMRIIGLYQVLRAGRASPCRYWPTCSEYAAEAVGHHGAAQGSLLALRRVLRCHPWGGHGFDPVPR